MAEHCNLNCAGCNHFSPLAKNELVDVQEFKRDIERMGILFKHDCKRIFLLGGEPLLHPEIINLMKIARDNFPNTDIYIYTNGILLPAQSENFWRGCHDNNINLMISRYPIKLDTEKIKNMAERFKIKIFWSSAPDGALNDSSFIVSPIDLNGNGNIKKSFANCYESNSCITLSHGKLYTCVFAAHVHHFNEKFGLNILITKDDYINIYKETDGNEILKKLNNPIPACKYCSGGRFSKSSRKIKWHHSEYNINEYL